MDQKDVQFPERKVLSQGSGGVSWGIRGPTLFPEFAPGAPPESPSLRGQGARGGLGAGKSRGQRPRPLRSGRPVRRRTPADCGTWSHARTRRSPHSERWSALGSRRSPPRSSPPSLRPHRPLPRLRSLPPARRRPRPLGARRTWRRRGSGGTLYLSTGPTACVATAASSSSSAWRELGAAGGGEGPGGVRGRAGAPQGGGGANRCTSLRSDQLRCTTWLHPRTGEPVNSGHMIRSGGRRLAG